MDLADRVPSEFLGMARVCRQGYIDAALTAGPQMRRIVSTMETAYKGKSTGVALRMLERSAEAWGRISKEGCLLQEVRLVGRRLTIADLRVTGSVGRQIDWHSPEPGLCLVGNALSAGPRKMGWEAPLITGVSLHGVARWFQRAFDASRDALERDMLLLAEASPKAVAEGKTDVIVRTDNGGSWRGRLAIDDEHLFISVRTFL